jgi:hypothetical protein
MTERRQLDALRAALRIPPEQIELDAVVPVLVPDSLATPAWPGPIVPLQVKGLAATWAALTPEQTMRYVTHEMAALWKDREWELQSLENVRSRSDELGTHSWLREDGSCFGLIMLYADGLGPSRLLLNADLEALFPEGYECAIPERSVGVVVSKAATAREKAEATRYVKRCYRGGTQPLLDTFFRPEDLVPRRRRRTK